MPKMRMKASEDKDKIRQLRQDIKDLKIDTKETFSVMETIEKPEKKRQSKKNLWIPIIVASVLIIAAAAYILLTAL